MAAAADKSRNSPDTKEATATPRRSLLVTALIALLAAGAAGGAVWYFTQGKVEAAVKSSAPAKRAPAPAKPAPAQYVALDPAFVVNLDSTFDGPRYLQVEVQLMTRDPEAVAALQTHAPAIRARLLMLFSQVRVEQIADRAGKEKLQAEALAEVHKLMSRETGKKSADELLFTSFVTQ